MKIRILSIACVATVAALLSACTAVYRNSGACEQLMRSKLAETSSDTLKIAHTGAGIDGSRVVVEGSIEHIVAASKGAASSAAGAMASGASNSPGVPTSLAASDAEAASLKLAKPSKTTTAAAAECTFHGSALAVFSWLAPAQLAAPRDGAASEATE